MMLRVNDFISEKKEERKKTLPAVVVRFPVFFSFLFFSFLFFDPFVDDDKINSLCINAEVTDSLAGEEVASFFL
ncbi:hypothetical protein I7I48_02873 [Histoplasma ohiense]|nr:hypothetical protein I7I48_02873 [Histoplasma ohiense (nom. inval.)]